MVIYECIAAYENDRHAAAPHRSQSYHYGQRFRVGNEATQSTLNHFDVWTFGRT